MLRVVTSILFLLILSSCKHRGSGSDLLRRGEVIAAVGEKELYKDDIEWLVPNGVKGKDSVNIVREYIETWALKQLMLKEAEEALPKKEKDVSKELEEYRMQLLIFRYENSYIAERLDTLVDYDEIAEHYNKFIDSFGAKTGIIKGWIARIDKSSPNLKIIESFAKKSSESDLFQMMDVAKSSAYMFDDFGGGWVELSTVSKEINLSVAQLQKSLYKEKVLFIEDDNYVNIFRVFEYVKQGEKTPLDYNTDKIKDVLLSKRKQELLSSFQEEILNRALYSKQLKIINNEKVLD